MKVAVTAAGGGLGSAIVKTLASQIGNEIVVGIARTPEKIRHTGVEIRKGDYNSKADFENSLPGVEILLLVSGMDPPDKRIEQHRNVINAALEAGVRKIVYTSIFGKEGTSSFDPIVKSNRQTEKDIRESGLRWSIGRNGLYIEPDVEYIDTYRKNGEISNCAGEGLCSYTTRDELAYAYAQMMLNESRDQQIFNLGGEAITQHQLAGYLNSAFGTNLSYKEVSPEAYLKFQQETNGEFLGKIIYGIYNKIRNGEFLMDSDYKKAAGREHISWAEYFASLKS